MNKLPFILWAMVVTLFNNHVKTEPAKPLTFRRGADEMTLITCDYEQPGRATFTTPEGERKRELLADSDVGQLVTSYGRATGVQIELPPLLGYGDEQAHAAGAGGGYGAPKGYGDIDQR